MPRGKAKTKAQLATQLEQAAIKRRRRSWGSLLQARARPRIGHPALGPGGTGKDPRGHPCHALVLSSTTQKTPGQADLNSKQKGLFAWEEDKWRPLLTPRAGTLHGLAGAKSSIGTATQTLLHSTFSLRALA